MAVNNLDLIPFKTYVYFFKNVRENFNGEIFNLAIQNIKIIDLAYQIKNHFKNLDIDIIQTRDDQDKRNYNVDIKNVKSFKI